MTQVVFEAASGRLRLDRTAFDTLVALARGHTIGQDGETAELRAAGVLDEHGSPAEALRAGLRAVADPVCRLEVRMQHADGRREAHEGWVAGHAAALLLAADGGLLELVSVHPSFLPEALARLVGLGPGPRLEGAAPVRLTVRTINQLTGSDPRARSAAAEQLRRAAAGTDQQATAQALGGGVRCRWEAVVTWPAAAGVAGRRALHVLDTPAGPWLLEPAGAGLLAWPTTPTTVWRALTTLLPRDHELLRIPAR